jgi:hypothetical protein
MKPKTITVTPISDDDYIVASVTPTTAALTLLQTTLTPAHKLLVTFGGDSTKTLTVVGTNERGFAVTEVITSAGAGTVASTAYFKTITSITPSSAYASTVKVGLAGLCVSQWIPLNRFNTPFNVSQSVIITGTLTCGVEHTLNDLQVLASQTQPTINTEAHATLTSLTASASGNYAFPVSGVRLKVTAFTSGSIEYTTIQTRG